MENYTPPNQEYQMENNVAFNLRIVAVIVVIAGIVGSVLLGSAMKTTIVTDALLGEVKTHYNWGVAVAGVFASVMSGILLYGFAELISLQGKAVDELKKISEKINKAPETEKTE